MSLFKREFKQAIKEGNVEENIAGLTALLNAEMLEKFGTPVEDMDIPTFVEYSLDLSEEIINELREEGFEIPQEEALNQIPPVEFNTTFPYEMKDHPFFIDASYEEEFGQDEEEDEEYLTDFEEALMYLKMGFKIARKEWGGYWAIEEWEKVDIGSVPLIVAYLKDGSFAPAQAYQGDILAEDWIIIAE